MFSPSQLKDYIGQEHVKANLQTILRALENKQVFDDPMDHTLLCGPPGLGKTSLAEIIACELQRPLIKLMGPQLKEIDSLSFLENIKPWTFVFIDEIHALPIKVEEALYEPMSDYKWQGQDINKFTLIGATTKEGTLTKPLRSRFTITETLSLYSVAELSQIVKRSATILKLTIDDKAVEAIAERSRGIPRVANNLLKRLSYYAESGLITASGAQKALDSIGVDKKGLEMLDRSILETIKTAFSGGPVGIDALANVVNEDRATVESRETYLVNIGFIQRTGKGRVLTAQGRKYLGDSNAE